MAEKRLKIGEVAAQLATSIRAIRYYEEEGLITPIRSAGGTRLYSAGHVDRLRAILGLSQSGYPLEVIKALAETRTLCQTGDQSQQAVGARLEAMQAEIQSHLARLQHLNAQVARARDTIRKCRGCANPPTSAGCPHCPVRACLAENEVLALVWDEDG